MEHTKRPKSSSDNRNSPHKTTASKSNDADQAKLRDFKEKEKYKNSSIPRPKGEKAEAGNAPHLRRKSSSSSRIFRSFPDMDEWEKKFRLLEEKEKFIADFYEKIRQLLQNCCHIDIDSDNLEGTVITASTKKITSQITICTSQDKPDILSHLETKVQEIADIWMTTSSSFSGALKNLKNSSSLNAMDVEKEDVKVQQAIKQAKSLTLVKTRNFIAEAKKLIHHHGIIRSELEKLLNFKCGKCGSDLSLEKSNEENSEKATKPESTSGGEGTSEYQENTSEIPENTSENPENTSEIPENTSENPENTSEIPENTSENPENTSEIPENISENPENLSEFPENTSENQGNTSENQGNTSELPGNTSENQGNTSEFPENSSDTNLQKKLKREKSRKDLGQKRRFSAEEDSPAEENEKGKSSGDTEATESTTQLGDVPSKENKDGDWMKEVMKKNETIMSLNNKVFELQKTLNDQSLKYNELQVRLSECQEKIQWNQVLWKQIGKLKEQVRGLQQSNKQLESQKKELESKMTKLDQEIGRLLKMNELLNKKKFLMSAQEDGQLRSDESLRRKPDTDRRLSDDKALAEKQNAITQLQTILTMLTDQKTIAQKQMCLYQSKIEELESMLKK